MRRLALAFALLAAFALTAAAALAEDPSPAAPAVVEEASGEAAAAPAETGGAAETEGESIDELLRSLEGTAGAESRYACEEHGACTVNLNCRVFYDLDCPSGTAPKCNNPSGYPCAGWCYCG
jgi:hypothetical protein